MYAKNSYFFRIYTKESYNTLLCLHAIDSSDYEIDNTIPYITGVNQVTSDNDIYHTFSASITTDKYFNKVLSSSINLRMFPVNELCKNNFINYCMYDTITRQLNILDFSEQSNYYA